ncbi:MAG: type III-A CRISPR-associated protein Cas10/Csm1 [Nitrospirae bacterium]|nr:type III-A CRISPR-associated protein Cas10/Csm1 [Nitrospirota bacterium]
MGEKVVNVTDNQTLYKVTLAALLHDIGKFPEFIDHIEPLLPNVFTKDNWGLEDTFINLVAGHHKPETPLQWIIAIADRISSGFERNDFEDYNKEIAVNDYKKTMMLTIFEKVSYKACLQSPDDHKYRYKLSHVSPTNIFPVETLNKEGATSSEEYKDLLLEFIDSLDKIRHKDNIPLWLEHFDSLFMIYTSNIPVSTVGKAITVTSLYDHSRTTAAIASALYKYHQERDRLIAEEIKCFNETKFIMIVGNFYGIQEFIFAESNSTGKASAKLLRGRSFTISLIVELAADMLCRELGLSITSIVFNAAGKFTVLAPNTEKAKKKSEGVETDINNWLIKHFYGQCSIGFSYVEASPNDLISKHYKQLKQKLLAGIERKKYSKINMDTHGGTISDYLDTFVDTLDDTLCPYCGKRPSMNIAKVGCKNSCSICSDHIFIGENLVKNDRIAITSVDADLKGQKLMEPIFDRYQLVFPTGDLNEISQNGTLIKYWNIGTSEEGKIETMITAKFINGYAPLTNKDEKSVMTFQEIASKALNHTDHTDGKTRGVEALGILKMDVDNLGNIMSEGISENLQNISLDASLSRQLNDFFTVFLPWKLKTDNNIKAIYTVFAGGDDLFLIGPWNTIIDAARLIRKSFREYVCHNVNITISAGIVINKPNEPVRILAKHSEEALSASKHAGRDRITLFGETVTWERFDELEEVKKKLNGWIDDKTINNAMIFRFNEITDMAKREKELKSILKNNGGVNIDEMECLKWRAMLKYTIARNVGLHLKTDDERTSLINEVSELTTQWFECYGGTMKIPLWQIIYNRRIF